MEILADDESFEKNRQAQGNLQSNGRGAYTEETGSREKIYTHTSIELDLSCAARSFEVGPFAFGNFSNLS
ncbi:hypothetical protein K3495_g15398 [Podosphaera aphanis]|nr:hypothetical protein K3495_g15398 [Podosphaera aphanis]